LRTLDRETFVLDVLGDVPANFTVEGYLVRVVDVHTLEVTVDRHEALNGLFERLSAKGIAVSSMRNKANRLEELFVALLHRNKPGEAA